MALDSESPPATARSPASILDVFEVPGFSRKVFDIGCSADRVTIHAQQQRAYNLAWALDREGLLDGRRIAVIGGGIAGLTFASTALVSQARVELYEKAGVLIPIQQGCITRHLHPNLYDWPEAHSMYPTTDLPFLNWSEDIADKVFRSMIAQWTKLAESEQERLTTHLSITVADLTMDDGRSQVTFRVDFKESYEEPFDLVILALGFGIENTSAQWKNTPSYWRNDDLAQPLLNIWDSRRYLVSGSGDGGLIDCLRLTLTNFNHAEFYDWLKEKEIWTEALPLLDPAADWNAWFNQFAPPEDVRTYLTDHVRTDTWVTLNFGSEFPNKGASRLNNFLVASLAKLDFIALKPGRLQRVLTDSTGELVACFGNELSGSEWFATDRVVRRHGPDNAQLGILDPFVVTARKKQWSDSLGADDWTFKPWYGFELHDRFMNANDEKEFEVLFTTKTFTDFASVAQNKLGINLVQDDKVSLANNKFIHCHGAAIRTNSKEILCRLLDGDDLPYTTLRFYCHPNTAPLRPVLDDGANIVFDAGDGSCLAVSHKLGDHLFSAHRVLTVSLLREILGNQLPLTKIHYLSWRLALPSNRLKVETR